VTRSVVRGKLLLHAQQLQLVPSIASFISLRSARCETLIEACGVKKQGHWLSQLYGFQISYKACLHLSLLIVLINPNRYMFAIRIF